MVHAACSIRPEQRKASSSVTRQVRVRRLPTQVRRTPGSAHPVKDTPERDARISEACTALSDLVRKVAYRFARRLPSHVDLDDLVGAGSLGLLLAVRQHVDKPLAELERLAVQRIRGAILDHLRASDPLTRRQRAAVGAVQRAREALEKEGGSADLAAVANAIGIPLGRAERIQHGLLAVQLTSLASADTVADSSEPMTTLMQRERERRVAQALARMPKRLQTLLSLYYYEELTYQEISEVLSISRSRVCQLHSQALLGLRRCLGARGAEL